MFLENKLKGNKEDSSQRKDVSSSSLIGVGGGGPGTIGNSGKVNIININAVVKQQANELASGKHKYQYTKASSTKTLANNYNAVPSGNQRYNNDTKEGFIKGQSHRGTNNPVKVHKTYFQ